MQSDVLDMIEVAFLPFGLTHSDIYKFFSTTSRRLHTHDAITLPDLHELLSKCYKDHTIVSEMKNCANLSGLRDQSGVFVLVHQITAFIYFQFRRDADQGPQDTSVTCLVTATPHETWKPIQNGNKQDISSVLRFLENLTKTPTEVLTSPKSLPEYDLRNRVSRIQENFRRYWNCVTRYKIFRKRSFIGITRTSPSALVELLLLMLVPCKLHSQPNHRLKAQNTAMMSTRSLPSDHMMIMTRYGFGLDV